MKYLSEYGSYRKRCRFFAKKRADVQSVILFFVTTVSRAGSHQRIPNVAAFFTAVSFEGMTAARDAVKGGRGNSRVTAGVPGTVSFFWWHYFIFSFNQLLWDQKLTVR